MSTTAAQQLARDEAQPEAAGFDRKVIHAHIKLLHDRAAATGVDGVLVLACYGENPDTGRKVSEQVQRFEIGDVDTMVKAIMAMEGIPHLNIYNGWHVMRRGLTGNQRGRKADIRCTLALPVDCDADTGKGGTLPLAAPYTIETSPGNFQPVYLLVRALPPNDAEPIAKALQRATGTDSGTGDIAHVFRVPGTLNWPNKKKLERGRPREPQSVKIASAWTGELIEPEKLQEAVAAHSDAKTNGHARTHTADASWQILFALLPESLKKLITSPPMPNEDRSAVAATVIFQLIRHGWNHAKIAAMIRAHPLGIGERYTEGNDLESDIRRLIEKQFDPARAKLPELNLDANPVVAAKELAKLIAEPRDVLLNGYIPVHVVTEAGQEPRAIPLNVEAVRAYAFEICRCMKTTRWGRREIVLPRTVAQLYLLGLEGKWGLRPLRGISTTPLLGADGSIRSATGYDEKTGLWCHNAPTSVVPDQPTKEDAEKALVTMRQAFRTFPFGDAVIVPDAVQGVDVVDLSEFPQLDESTHLIALMTAVCRPCLTLAPGFLYNASAVSGAGTGKGLLLKSACVVANGSQPSAMSAGHSTEELDKRLVAAAISAQPVIYLDNFNEGQLKSDTLASFLTEDPARVRVLGQSKLVPLNSRAFVVITGNAVQISEDMARRVLQVGLDARMENPEQRPFAPGFLDGIASRRVELLSACLTIWRWGIQQGEKLPRGRAIGSYEQWARWCRDPLLALGCRDPIDRIADIKAADPRRRQLVEVFTLWDYRHGDKPVTAADLHSDVKEAIDTGSKRDADGVHSNRQKVVGFLRAHTDTRVGGFHLKADSIITTEQRNKVGQYRLVKLRDAR